MTPAEAAALYRKRAASVRGPGRRAALKRWGVLLVGEAKRNATRVFRTTSQGGLRQTIHETVIRDSQLRIRVPKPYAAIHEFGGRTGPHVIVPRRANALRFVVNGRVVFARRVLHPGSRFKERRYLRDALDATKAEGLRLLGGAVTFKGPA